MVFSVLFQELRSLCKLLKIPINEDQLQAEQSESPFLLLDLPGDEEARLLVQRSVLMKSCYECLVHAREMTHLREHIQRLPADLIATYSTSGSSFRLRIHAYGRKLSSQDVRNRIELLKVFPLDSRVDLQNPTHSFHLLEDYGLEDLAEPALQPAQLFFGRWLADSNKDAAHKLRLDERYFIGTTSMDPLLALVMANQALVSPGSLVYDPFVGTGSLIIAAAYFGGYTFGADIDKILLHGRGRSTRAKKTWRKSDESVLANFRQYGLEKQYVDVLVADATSRFLRDDVQFDAIIADPPYGVREPIARVGKEKFNPSCDDTQAVSSGMPAGADFQLGRCVLNDLIITLVSFAAKHLRTGGRLVYWLPVLQDEYNDSAVPRHACFDVISNSEQCLSGSTSRRLITMEKVKDWDPNYQVTFAKEIYTETFRERYFTSTKDKDRPKHLRFKNKISRKVRPTEPKELQPVTGLPARQ
ncbi:tRNA (guanine(10)-N2)-methyltransferase-like protein [Hypsibius exemplaris]|uniref:tRNA (guanine(10)-N(2))-methyltransferase TRMT11 n=1 Tax=Hypsibius exemplaris TaxID=2072580 RepID=A0A1W0XCV7_HYPEX|nr:tRNA (guanine(10)-N2)-methyltransferase-like protein [Hypsibius exemplaris]